MGELTCKNKEVKAKLELDADGRPTAGCLRDELAEAVAACDSARAGGRESVAVFDTYFLTAVEKHDVGSQFLALAAKCKSVIAARVSPDQKGEIVRLVRGEAKKTKNDALVTLAIGDGANDVTMIKAAHIGVGIDGLEGKQAVNNSDYAIGQFKYLQRLLFVHGRWSYRRMSIVILYMFYKNCLLVLPQWMFGIYSQFSGQNFYLEFPLYQLSNIAFSAFPILAFGILDQDVVAEVPMKVPSLYKDGNTLGIHYSGKTFWLWMLDGTWSAAVCTFFGVWSLGLRPANGEPVVSSGTGRVGDMWYLGCIIHLSVTIVQNLRLMIEVRSYNWLTILTYVFSISAWFVLMTMFANLPGLSFAFASKYAVGMDKQVNEDALMWITVCLSVVVSILPSLVYKAWRTLTRPSLYILSEELQKENYLEVRPFTEFWCGCGICGGGARAGVECDNGQTAEDEESRMRAAVAAARKSGKAVNPQQGAWLASVGPEAVDGQSGVEMVSREEKTTSSRDAENLESASKTMDKFGNLHELLLSKKY